MFSATQTRKVEDLARISLGKVRSWLDQGLFDANLQEPVYVGVDDHLDTATPANLKQVWMIQPSVRC